MGEKQASGFVWYELMTSDLDAAVAFYGTVVGWDVRDSGMPGMQYMLFGKDGKDVGGMVAWSSMGLDKPTAWKGHVYTAEVDAETKAVVADGGTEFRPPTDIPGVGRFSVVGDPQGVEYLLFQPGPVGAMLPRLGPYDQGGKHYGWQKDTAVNMGPMGTYQTFRTVEGAAGGGMMNLPSALQEKGVQPAWLFYFTVDSIAAAQGRVTANGGVITHGPAEVPGPMWIVQATDPQGGSFALVSAQA